MVQAPPPRPPPKGPPARLPVLHPQSALLPRPVTWSGWPCSGLPTAPPSPRDMVRLAVQWPPHSPPSPRDMVRLAVLPDLVSCRCTSWW